jgi:hypothetical protein
MSKKILTDGRTTQNYSTNIIFKNEVPKQNTTSTLSNLFFHFLNI